eukprot:6022992-Pyramimonas_sp.AAC.1
MCQRVVHVDHHDVELVAEANDLPVKPHLADQDPAAAPMPAVNSMEFLLPPNELHPGATLLVYGEER